MFVCSCGCVGCMCSFVHWFVWSVVCLCVRVFLGLSAGLGDCLFACLVERVFACVSDYVYVVADLPVCLFGVFVCVCVFACAMNGLFVCVLSLLLCLIAYLTLR